MPSFLLFSVSFDFDSLPFRIFSALPSLPFFPCSCLIARVCFCGWFYGPALGGVLWGLRGGTSERVMRSGLCFFFFCDSFASLFPFAFAFLLFILLPVHSIPSPPDLLIFLSFFSSCPSLLLLPFRNKLRPRMA